jgi:hypothetical protein
MSLRNQLKPLVLEMLPPRRVLVSGEMLRSPLLMFDSGEDLTDASRAKYI